MLALVARDDLRFGFDLESAQLVAHAQVGRRQLRDGAAERTELLFEAGTVDRDFTGIVDQAVEQVGADAHLLLRGTHADVAVLTRQRAADRRGQRLEFDLASFGLRLVLGHDGGIAGPQVGVATRTRIEFADQFFRHRDRAAGTDPDDHRMQAVEAALQQRHAIASELTAVLDHRFQQRFHDVAEFAHGHDAGHACTALERVQVALQANH